MISKTVIAEFDLFDTEHAVVMGIKFSDTNYSIYARVITEDEIYKPDDRSEAKWDTKTYLWPPEPDPFAV